eukprot:TRINITY_DN1304_c0_g1_i1.p1 TRINITY_DN1304_c0_g1~~TRINITY_DN1304_c0_g1_i1.p1  ORF type:complete len:146 (+),score=22.25 TRINITY_DN1304_c0_g1_i1:43-480(+)
MATSTAPKLPGFLGRLANFYVGNRRMFSGKWMQNLEQKNPIVAKLNDVLNLAPAVKWGLSIVPIGLALSGAVPPEKVDIKQSAALGTTGIVWTYYGFLLSRMNPGMLSLMLVNASMAAVHCTNFFRGITYKKQEAKRPENPTKNE